MASIASIVARFKDEPHLFLTDPRVHDACVAAGYTWRQRHLGPALTLRLMVLQVLMGNVACRRLKRLTCLPVSVAAYARARARLPIDVLTHTLWQLNGHARQATDSFGRWRGHRVLFIDGSGVSTPDTPALQRAFGQPGRAHAGCGFPVIHTLWLFDAATGLIVDYVAARWNTHDLAAAAKLHPMIAPGDVLVGDRAFCSYTHLALLYQQGLHAVVRAHQRAVIDFTPGRKPRRQRPKHQRAGAPTSRWIESLGTLDQLVEWAKPPTRPGWISVSVFDALPDSLIVRELRYTTHRRGFRSRPITLVTTLTCPRKYPKQELAELYKSRWQIETNLRHLKTTMGMDVLRCRSVEGVTKELLAYAIAYNLVRLSMLEAATRQGVRPGRVSFIDALDVLCPSGGKTLPLMINPQRPGRDEPRVIKRPKDRYTYMTRPRDELRQSLGIMRLTA